MRQLLELRGEPVEIGRSPAPLRTHSISSARLRSIWLTSRSRSSESSMLSRWNVPPGEIALTWAVHLALKSGSSASSTVRFESTASLVFVSEIRATTGTEFSTIATLSWLAASILTTTGVPIHRPRCSPQSPIIRPRARCSGRLVRA